MICSLVIFCGLDWHILEQYFLLPWNSFWQVGQILILGRLLEDFELLIVAAHDFEQKQIPERGISCGCLLKTFWHLGFPHFKVFCLFLDRL